MSINLDLLEVTFVLAEYYRIEKDEINRVMTEARKRGYGDFVVPGKKVTVVYDIDHDQYKIGEEIRLDHGADATPAEGDEGTPERMYPEGRHRIGEIRYSTRVL